MLNINLQAHYIANSREQLNPNLYQEGKICTSLLGTWDGVGVEKWDPSKSNLLQVALSIQALILVRDPFFNEAGYENRRNEPESLDHSRRYNEVASVNSLEYLIKSYEFPRAYVADVIRSHIRQEYPGLRQRLQRIAAGEMPKYDVMMSKGFRMAIEKMVQRMDEVIGPVDSTTTKSVQTSVRMEEAGCSKKDMNELVKEEDEGKTNENTIFLVLSKRKCLGDDEHPSHEVFDVKLNSTGKHND
ncbi:hypothetical protein WR25_22705 [Diploscapter pachys]|uniref:Uncharacterized protein n=1 Tax=Diploscapter pachys TaxID=2018661 RepID=A0A2A2M1F0_9BILA|nr:hypothetical protein WR25_22705 [Diploscapter pachys]